MSRNVRNNAISFESGLIFRQPFGDFLSAVCKLAIFVERATFQDSPFNNSIETLPNRHFSRDPFGPPSL